MHRVPRQIESALREKFQRRGADSRGMGSGLKWCRFFIDFCLNMGFSPRVEESVPEFMKKLASKGQGPVLREEASQAVAVLQQILPRFETVEDGGNEESGSPGEEDSPNLVPVLNGAVLSHLVVSKLSNEERGLFKQPPHVVAR